MRFDDGSVGSGYLAKMCLETGTWNEGWCVWRLRCGVLRRLSEWLPQHGVLSWCSRTIGALHGISTAGAKAYLAKISSILDQQLAFHISHQSCPHVL